MAAVVSPTPPFDPIGVLELVLNVEKPNSATTGDGHHGQLDYEPGNKTEN